MSEKGHPDRAKSGRSAKARPKKKRPNAKRPKPKRRAAPLVNDPSDTDRSELRFVQPYEATKSYLCPGCNRDIPPGMGHMVAIPPDAPDLRRHWHRGCWNNRHNRR